MKARLPLLLLPTLLLSACNFGPWDAPYTARLVVPEDLSVPWFSCAIDPTTGQAQVEGCVNSGSVVFPVTVSVVDNDTELPLNNVRISASSTFNEIYLLPQDVIEAVQLPDTTNWNTVDGSGQIYAEFSGNWEGDYKPTYLETWTDRHGRLTVWVWINSFPVDLINGQPIETSIIFDIGAEILEMSMKAGA